jgi:hypothetical protein
MPMCPSGPRNVQLYLDGVRGSEYGIVCNHEYTYVMRNKSSSTYASDAAPVAQLLDRGLRAKTRSKETRELTYG